MNSASLCVVVAVLCAAIAPGCAATSEDHPTVEQAFDRIFPAYCGKIAQCFKSAFDALYPGGTPECTKKSKEGASKDLKKQSACSSSDIDKCTVDTNALACPATVDKLGLPASCSLC